MTTRLLIPAMILLAVSFTILSAPQSGTGSLEGTVVNSVTMQPLSNVQISVAHASASTLQLNLLSDQDGRFAVSGIPTGTVIVVASLEGYYGPERDDSPPGVVVRANVTEGQTTRIPLALVPGGTISGQVFDNLGQPAFGRSVQLLRLTYSNGIPIVTPSSMRMTDDRGEYRHFGQRPGDYYIAVNPKPIPADVQASAPPVEVRTLFPRATDISQASLIRLHAGEELSGTNIGVQTASLARLSGQIVSSIPESDRGGTAGIPNATLTIYLHDKYALQDPGTNRNISVSMGTPGNGHFEILNLIPGVYDLYASLPDILGFGPLQPPGKAAQPVAYGRTTIDVHGGDQDGVTIVVHHGIEIKGRVSIDGGPSPTLSKVRISLQPDDSAARLQVYQQVGRFQPAIDPDGAFSIPAVPEAQYRFQIAMESPLAGSGYVSDILQAGLSVYDGGIFVGSQNIPPVDIRVKTDGGSVEGVVNGLNQKSAPGTTVVLVPPVQRRQNPALYKTAISNASGHFSMTAIPPGEYKLYAWESVPAAGYMNADVLKDAAEKAISINVSASIQLQTQLTLIPASR